MKPKVSTGYLTPQSSKKIMSNKKRPGSTENLFSGCEISDELFKQLMNDPVKKQVILNIITSEKDTIEAYKKTLQRKNQASPLYNKTLKKPYESPTALFRRRALEQQKNSSDNNSDSGGSSRPESRQSTASTVPSPISFEKVLLGVTAFVEVRSGLRDRSDAVKAHLVSMGAVVRDKFTKDVTHVVFKDGSFTTYQKANLMKVHLVSVLWLEACKNNGIKVPEKNYPALGTDGYNHNVSALCSQMQKDYEEIIDEERNLLSTTSLLSEEDPVDNNLPSEQEKNSIKNQYVPSTSRHNQSPEMSFDNDSDLEPMINGDIVEKDSNIFENFHVNSNNKKLSQTNNQHEDMDLTNLQRESKLNLKENCSPNIYNQKTPKIRQKVQETSSIESFDFLDNNLYRRKTELYENRKVIPTDNETNQDSNSDTELTPRSVRIFNNIPSTSKEKDVLTPRNLHIFNRNSSCGTPDATKKLQNKIVQQKTVDTINIIEPAEKTSSTNMSSLRISDNSSKKSTTNKSVEKNNSLISKKASFSPISSQVINNILEGLQVSPVPSSSSSSNDSSDKPNKDTSEPLETPNNKLKNLSYEHITLRKQYPKSTHKETELDSILNENITKDFFLTTPSFAEDENDVIDERDKRATVHSSKQKGLVMQNESESMEKIKIPSKKKQLEEIFNRNKTNKQLDVQKSSNKRKTTNNLKESNATGNSKNPVARTLYNEFQQAEVSDKKSETNMPEDELCTTNKPKRKCKTRQTIGDLSRTNKKEEDDQNLESDQELKKELKETNQTQNKRKTIGPLSRDDQSLESDEKLNKDLKTTKASQNNRKTIGPLSRTNRKEKVDQSLESDEELNKDLKDEKDSQNKRKTIVPLSRTNRKERDDRSLKSDQELNKDLKETKESQNKRKTIDPFSRTSRKEKDDQSLESDQELNKEEDVVVNSKSINADRQKSKRQTISADCQTNSEIDKIPPSTNSNRNRTRQTIGEISQSKKKMDNKSDTDNINEVDEMPPSKNKKILIKSNNIISPSKRKIQNEQVTTDNNKKLKESTAEEQNNVRRSVRNIRRQTISSSRIGDEETNSKEFKRTMSSTDLNKSPVSPDASTKTRKLRKLYDPDDVQITDVNDDEEREEKRKAKKQKDDEMFLKPIVFSEKVTAIMKNLKKDDSSQKQEESPAETESSKNKKNISSKYNSDDDEQVELKEVLLNKKKGIDNKQDANRSKSSFFQTPRPNDKKHTNQTQNLNKKDTKSPKKIPNQTPKQTRSRRRLSVKMTPIVTPVNNRRSTLEFQALNHSSRKKLKIDKPQKPSIVCTKMTKDNVQIFMQIVKKLGKFDVEDEVSEKTTHLVVGEAKRTINMLRAITRGCWILKKEWLLLSLESRKWLPEEDFEETDFSPAVQKNRLYRQAFGPTYTMDIFQNCGPMYVSKGSIPRCSDLRELIQLCKGRITSVPRSASIIIGEYLQYDQIVCVSETWILDCISSNKKLAFKKFILTPKRRSVIV